jgi:hypothetical protein
LDRPFSVYTRNDAWTARAQRVKRKMRLVGSLLQAAKGLVVTIKDKLTFVYLFRRNNRGKSVEEEPPRVLTLVTSKSGTKLKVLKLGDSGSEDAAWEGEEDPFVHLSADERQKLLKTMVVKAVQMAGKKQKRIAMRNQANMKTQRKLVPKIPTGTKPFKKPEEI